MFKEVNTEGDQISFKTLDDEEFGINFSSIKNSNLYGRHEVEMNIPLDDFNDNHDILCDIRFYIPEAIPEPEAEPENAEDGEEQNDDGKIKEETVKAEFHTKAEIIEKDIRKKSKIDENMGELVARVENLSLVVPRGKYTADLHMNNMKLHGSTFNYKILYQNVVKAFLLPNNDGIHYSLVLGFSKPLRQGNTKYPYIIFQFKISKRLELELNPPAETLSQIHKNLKPAYSGPAYEIVAKLFKMIIGVNIIIPGSFKTSQGYSSLKCTVGNQEGHLFMMNKSMIFIKKPVIYIRLGDVARIEFQRVTGGLHMRGFDFEVVLKNGMSTIYSGADKRELDTVTAYFKKAGIPVKTINEMNNLDAELGMSDEENSIVTEDRDGEEEEDDDFVAPDDNVGGDEDWGSDEDGVDED